MVRSELTTGHFLLSSGEPTYVMSEDLQSIAYMSIEEFSFLVKAIITMIERNSNNNYSSAGRNRGFYYIVRMTYFESLTVRFKKDAAVCHVIIRTVNGRKFITVKNDDFLLKCLKVALEKLP